MNYSSGVCHSVVFDQSYYYNSPDHKLIFLSIGACYVAT